jgi:SUN domain-containing protein 1/2
MEGSKGQVTIRLAYPVKVDTFSVDHVSPEIVPDDMEMNTPKRMRVIGYPPCIEDECRALGFDVTAPMEIAQINYDADGPSVQMFESIWVQAAANSEDEDEVDDEYELEEEDDEGSCAKATSCSSPPRIDVAAITLKIVENYRNPEYTCLYRFRVHGEPA